MDAIWPNFFIVGTIRAGTTSLHEYLNSSPNIYMSLVKEPHFFAKIRVTENSHFSPIRDEQKYLKLFSKVKDEKAIGEASPTYLQDPKAPYLIHKYVPKARIIIILRDPVERAFSHYLLLMNKGWEKHSFGEIIRETNREKKDALTDVLEAGMYHEQVKRYLDIFGSDQVKILIFEEFAKDTRKAVREVLEFLGINDEPPEVVDKTYNPFSIPKGPLSRFLLSNNTIRQLGNKLLSSSTRLYLRENFLLKKSEKPLISIDDKNFLINYYQNDVEKLKKLLNRPLPWRNFKFH